MRPESRSGRSHFADRHSGGVKSVVEAGRRPRVTTTDGKWIKDLQTEVRELEPALWDPTIGRGTSGARKVRQLWYRHGARSPDR